MKTLEETVARIEPISEDAARAARARLDDKTKPPLSLGKLERLAIQLAAVAGSPAPSSPTKALVVMGADHGVAAEGVSAYPQAVTAQMLLNMASGGAAISVLAQHAGAELVLVDVGVNTDQVFEPPVRSAPAGAGTANMTRGPAMTSTQLRSALGTGIDIAHELTSRGVTVIGLGEMGIANTTASSAICAALLGEPVRELVGRGTGIDDQALARKIDVIERALVRNQPDPDNPLDVLAKVGGFELAGLAGVALGAAQRRALVVMDGFIASTAALCAARLCPAVGGYLVAAHRSVEAGHPHVLGALDKQPLLDLDLRLGEGTGAALAMPLIDASVRILNDMATFDQAGVSDRSHS